MLEQFQFSSVHARKVFEAGLVAATLEALNDSPDYRLEVATFGWTSPRLLKDGELLSMFLNRDAYRQVLEADRAAVIEMAAHFDLVSTFNRPDYESFLEEVVLTNQV